MGVYPGAWKVLTGALEVQSGVLDALTGKRCEHTGWLTDCGLAFNTPHPHPASYVMLWKGGMGSETSLRDPFEVTRGLLYIKPPMHLWFIGLVARSHSSLVFSLFTVHSYKFIHPHSFITFVEFRSNFFIAASSGRGSPLGCRAEIQTRGSLTAARHATNWAMPHPNWAMPHPVLSHAAP